MREEQEGQSLVPQAARQQAQGREVPHHQPPGAKHTRERGTGDPGAPGCGMEVSTDEPAASTAQPCAAWGRTPPSPTSAPEAFPPFSRFLSRNKWRFQHRGALAQRTQSVCGPSFAPSSTSRPEGGPGDVVASKPKSYSGGGPRCTQIHGPLGTLLTGTGPYLRVRRSSPRWKEWGVCWQTGPEIRPSQPLGPFCSLEPWP